MSVSDPVDALCPEKMLSVADDEGREIPQFYVCCICVAAVTGIIPALSHIQQDLLTLDRISPSSQTGESQ